MSRAAATTCVRHGELADAPFDVVVTPEGRRLGLHRAARARRSAPGESARLDTGDVETLVLPLSGACDVDVRRRDASTVHGRARVRRRHRLRLRARATPTVDGHERARRPVRPAVSAVCDDGCRCGTSPPTRCRSSCAAPGRRAGRSTTSARRRRSRPTADRLRGADAGAATGRRTRRTSTTRRATARACSRRSTTSRSPTDPPAPGIGLPARLRPRERRDRRARRGAQRRRRADPARLARPVDGGARLRPLLPQRDGRPGDERAWLICDDPAHAWVRDTWADQDVDPRLPLRAQETDAR